MAFKFEKLEAWQKAVDFCDREDYRQQHFNN
jgi:hypothetical protein